jgi:hypothetical protein
MKRILILSFAGLLMGVNGMKNVAHNSITTMNVGQLMAQGITMQLCLMLKEINVKTSGRRCYTLIIGSRNF